jgi:hypothetical protein
VDGVYRDLAESARRIRFRKMIEPELCGLCGVRTWMGKPLPKFLVRLDAKTRSNRLENLRWMCPDRESQWACRLAGAHGDASMALTVGGLAMSRKREEKGRARDRGT